MDKIDFVNSTHPAVNDENLNRMQDNIERAINAQVSGDTLPIGALMPFSSDTIPANWLLCDGREIDRTEYNQLFAVIGTKYGNGDGSTTFNLPDMRGRVAVGQDTSDTDLDRLGKKGGEKAHTLTIDEMPSHSHTAINYANGYTGGSQDRFFTLIAGVETGGTPKAVKETGSSQPHNIMQPYSVQNYIIKAFQSSGTVANIVNSHSESISDTYSCDYVNSIIETGKNEKGSYIKYKNGTLECRGNIEFWTDINEPWGSWFAHVESNSYEFPHSFISTEDLTVVANNSNAGSSFAIIKLDYTETEIARISIGRGNSINNVQVKISYVAIGRWK